MQILAPTPTALSPGMSRSSVLTLRSSYATYREALVALSATLESYANWEDTLSLQLFSWGVSTLERAESGSMRDVAQKIGELTVLLRNPIDGAILRSPYLAGGEVWEQWMLEEYVSAQRAMGDPIQSPFDASKSLEARTEHLFAKEMIHFLSGMPQEIFSLLPHDLESSDRLHQWTFVSLDPQLKIMEIYFRAMITKGARTLAASQAREQALEDCMSGRVETAVTELRAEIHQVRQDSTRNIQEIRSTYTGAQTALETNLGLVRQDLEQERIENRNNANRADQAEARLAVLAARISDLENQDNDSICSLM